MNYYPFHIGDFLSATRHLSWDESMAYRSLLDVYYMSEKPIPLDERKVFRLVLATTDAQREAVLAVLAEFFERTEAGFVNARAEREINAMREKQQKQRDRANKRWAKPVATAGSATELPACSADQSPAEPWQQEGHAAASKQAANALPPTPTPTPTPTPKKERKEGLDPGGSISGDSPDPVKAMFDAGVPMLVDSGQTDKSARSLIGRLRQVLGDQQAAAAIVSARSMTDPAAYLSACTRPKQRGAVI